MRFIKVVWGGVHTFGFMKYKCINSKVRMFEFFIEATSRCSIKMCFDVNWIKIKAWPWALIYRPVLFAQVREEGRRKKNSRVLLTFIGYVDEGKKKFFKNFHQKKNIFNVMIYSLTWLSCTGRSSDASLCPWWPQILVLGLERNLSWFIILLYQALWKSQRSDFFFSILMFHSDPDYLIWICIRQYIHCAAVT